MKVQCIEPGDWQARLTLMKVYEVIGKDKDVYYKLKEDDLGYQTEFLARRFIIVEDKE